MPCGMSSAIRASTRRNTGGRFRRIGWTRIRRRRPAEWPRRAPGSCGRLRLQYGDLHVLAPGRSLRRGGGEDVLPFGQPSAIEPEQAERQRRRIEPQVGFVHEQAAEVLRIRAGELAEANMVERLGDA